MRASSLSPPIQKRRSRKPNKSECACGCGMKKVRKRRYVSGHNQFSGCPSERVPASTRYTSQGLRNDRRERTILCPRPYRCSAIFPLLRVAKGPPTSQPLNTVPIQRHIASLSDDDKEAI